MQNTALKWLLLTTLILSTLALTGCQSGPPRPEITVEGAWGRPSPQAAPTGAFYLRLKNAGRQADRLVSAQSPACSTVEVHETYETAEGAMGMRPVEDGVVEIPAKGEVEFKTGGLHLMCIGKLTAFTPGTRLPLRLQFQKSGEITVEVEVREP